MARLRRRGRILKWAGAIFSLLIVVTWMTSLFSSAHCANINRATTTSGQPYFGWHVGIWAGELWLRYGDVHAFFGSNTEAMRGLGLDYDVSREPGVNMIWTWVPYDPYAGDEKTRHGRMFTWAVVVPLWMPFLVFVLPTAFLFWRDRRYPRHCCQKCGYNLTGNVSGVCPECGMRI